MKPIKETYTQLEMLRTFEYVAQLENTNEIIKAQLVEANAECEQKSSEIERLREGLRRFSGINDGRQRYCPSCQQTAASTLEINHKPNCWLNALLEGKDEKA